VPSVRSCLKYSRALNPRARLSFSREPTEALTGWYTFQLTPLPSRNSGTVSQLQLPTASADWVTDGVDRIGPPWEPAGSRVPVSHMTRLGIVGPITEQ